MKKYFLKIAFFLLIFIIVVLTSVLLFGSPQRTMTASKPTNAPEHSTDKVRAETPYEIKDKRNNEYFQLNNGQVVEYYGQYNKYIRSIFNMTDYQRENRSHDKDGLYFYLDGVVRYVEENGTIRIRTGGTEDEPTTPKYHYLEASITLTTYQADLLLKLEVGDTIGVFARIDDYSYYRDFDANISSILFDLYDGFIVGRNGISLALPQDFKLGVGDTLGTNPNGVGSDRRPLGTPLTEGIDTTDAFANYTGNWSFYGSDWSDDTANGAIGISKHGSEYYIDEVSAVFRNGGKICNGFDDNYELKTPLTIKGNIARASYPDDGWGAPIEVTLEITEGEFFITITGDSYMSTDRVQLY